MWVRFWLARSTSSTAEWKHGVCICYSLSLCDFSQHRLSRHPSTSWQSRRRAYKPIMTTQSAKGHFPSSGYSHQFMAQNRDHLMSEVSLSRFGFLHWRPFWISGVQNNYFVTFLTATSEILWALYFSYKTKRTNTWVENWSEQCFPFVVSFWVESLLALIVVLTWWQTWNNWEANKTFVLSSKKDFWKYR